jgi:3'(2'), 5'-bisphosphate nucleotidase
MAILASQLFSVILQLSQRAIHEIRRVHATGVLDTVNKGSEAKLDPCTAADLQSQLLIMSNLLHYFPDLTVTGEEELRLESSAVLPRLSLDLISPCLLPQSLRELELSDLNVWVDPLDGTLDFVNGNLISVTTLIGVAQRGRPIFGAVGHVFAETPLVYWGGPGIGTFRTTGDDSWEEFKLPPQERFIVGSTKNHEDAQLVEFIQSLGADEVIKIGGSGCKTLSVLLGDTAAHVFPKGQAKKWDGCAVEALITSYPEGRYTAMDGLPYDYRIEGSHALHTGILATRNPELHEFIVRTYKAAQLRKP